MEAFQNIQVIMSKHLPPMTRFDSLRIGDWFYCSDPSILYEKVSESMFKMVRYNNIVVDGPRLNCIHASASDLVRHFTP